MLFVHFSPRYLLFIHLYIVGSITVLMCICFDFVFSCSSDEYRIKPVEEVKYMKNGGEDDQKIAARNQENLVRNEHIIHSTTGIWFCVCNEI